ncbi:NAD-dependent deacetylase [Desulfitobacterium sp. Sab5]|uniref:SIR2 family NAD-dependent protein deacylase n=1 Tax=Desulfitobacterium nosdiversum TaxID=3375356 RepID=UPI003CF5DC37
MSMSIQINTDNISEAVKRINEADSILIGAGAGLSASGGLNYNDPELFKKWFPRLNQFGIRTIGEAISIYWQVNDSNRRAFWAYWANHIQKIRYDAPVLQPYMDLFDMVKNKDYFIITTNVDGQFVKAGFDQDKIFAPQGDYGLFQCDGPCSNELFDNRSLIDKMISNMNSDDFLIREEDIPRCPNCGSYLAKNLRIDHTFVEEPHMRKQKDYLDFINQSVEGKLLLIELGVGFNTPVIIRWPFEQITAEHPHAELIRINMDNSKAPEKITSKCLAFNRDIAQVITEMKNIILNKNSRSM